MSVRSQWDVPMLTLQISLDMMKVLFIECSRCSNLGMDAAIAGCTLASLVDRVVVWLGRATAWDQTPALILHAIITWPGVHLIRKDWLRIWCVYAVTTMVSNEKWYIQYNLTKPMLALRHGGLIAFAFYVDLVTYPSTSYDVILP